MAGSVALCSRYTDAIPLVDRGGMRHKLARLSAALACRTFSCGNRDPRACVVRPCHVEHVVGFLDATYGSPTFGYLDYSRASGAADALVDPDLVRKKLLSVPFARDFVNSMLHTQDIELRDICDWCGWEHDPGRELLSFLVRKHALVRERAHYRKTGRFIELLRDLAASDELARMDRPDWIRDVDARDM